MDSSINLTRKRSILIEFDEKIAAMIEDLQGTRKRNIPSPQDIVEEIDEIIAQISHISEHV